MSQTDEQRAEQPPAELEDQPADDAAPSPRRTSRLAELREVRRQRAAEDRERRRLRKVENLGRRDERRAEDVDLANDRRAEDLELRRQRQEEDAARAQARKEERARLQEEAREKKAAARAAHRARKEAEVAAKAAEKERRAAERAAEAERRAAEQAAEAERKAAEQAAEAERKAAERAEQEEQRRLQAEAKQAEQERRLAEKAEQKARHEAAVAEQKAADAEARELVRQAKEEARRLKAQRKAEDAEVRRQRKAEDAERRKVLASDARVRVRRHRRWLLGVGVFLLAFGLSIAGYIGWQLWGTNWLSQRAHERIAEDVREEWEVASNTTLTRPAAPTVDVPEGKVSGLVRIPEFGDGYEVPILEGTSDKVLAAGFGHFTDSADPGEIGNYALAAHRVTHGEPLRDMPELEVGDEVIIETQYATYTYELITDGDDLRVTFRDYWVVDSLPTNPDADGVQPPQLPGQRLLTLTTCAELFHTDDRLVAYGVLKDTDLKS